MNRGSDREAVVDRLLRQSLARAGGAAPRGQCLDSEILAAWVDGTLKRDELKAAEAHLSDCSRCLSIVATMVKLAPEREPVTRWWGIGSLRWWVPLTAGVAAIVVWIAVPGDRSRPPEQTIARTEITQPEPAAQQAPEELRSEATDKRSPVQPATRLRGNQQPERTDADANTDAKASAAREAAKEVEPSRPTALSEFQAVGRDERPSPPPPPAAPASDSARTAAVGALEERVTSGASPPSPGAAAPASMAARSAQVRRDNSEAGAAVIEIASSDAASRWRVGARGFVQLSRDRGATWEVLGSGVTADLVAGASPSASVCWVVGRAGTVLLTTDGRNWQRLTFPEPIDLTAVRATDARTATVTTADGRMFTTTNGGLTWMR
ncbi:MAG TPA: YCF48-related protein [Vicinamibacterales bacterium]